MQPPYGPNPYGNPGQSDQTTSSYGQPTYPYQQQPYQNPYPPQPPRSPMQSRWYRWYSQSPEAKAYRTAWAKTPRGMLISCGGLIVIVLFLCGLCGVITNAGSHANQSATADQTTPTTQVVQSHIAPTSAPTATPVPPTPTPEQAQPTPVPTSPPAPSCDGTVMDGICYDTNPGSYVYNTPTGFCVNYACIASFSSGTGYIVECGNQEWSHSGGKSGACSRDGGVIATLYSH